MVEATKAGITVQGFNEFLTDKDSLKSLQDCQMTFKEGIDQQLLNLQGDRNPLNIKGRQFLRWIRKQSNNGFYVLPVDDAMGLVKKNLKVFFIIGLHRPNELIEELFENEFCLELKIIVSIKKGEGYRVMKKLLEFTQRMNMPLYLWTETERNVEYFERYGFRNYGRLGDNHEFLMIFKP